MRRSIQLGYTVTEYSKRKLSDCHYFVYPLEM